MTLQKRNPSAPHLHLLRDWKQGRCLCSASASLNPVCVPRNRTPLCLRGGQRRLLGSMGGGCGAFQTIHRFCMFAANHIDILVAACPPAPRHYARHKELRNKYRVMTIVAFMAHMHVVYDAVDSPTPGIATPFAQSLGGHRHLPQKDMALKALKNYRGGGNFARGEFRGENFAVKKGGEIFPWRNFGVAVPS